MGWASDADGTEPRDEDWAMMNLYDTQITTHQIKCVLDFLHDGCDERIEKRPGNAARAARDRISVARSNVRVSNGLSRSRDRISWERKFLKFER